MDLRKLEVFVNVVHQGNFSKAAEALYLTQPTVSAHIDGLEKSLGVILFERRGRLAVLTAAGRVFYPHALETLRSVERGQQSLKLHADQLRGEVRLAASSTPGIHWLPARLSAFRQQHPSITFDIQIVDSSEAATLVSSYAADMGLVGRELPEHTTLACSRIAKDRLVAAVPRLWAPAQAKAHPLSIEELIGYPLVMRHTGSATREAFLNALQRNGHQLGDLDIVAEVDSLEAAKSCVRAGLGVAVLSELCALRDADILACPVPELEMERSFYLVHRKTHVFTAAAEMLHNYLLSDR